MEEKDLEIIKQAWKTIHQGPPSDIQLLYDAYQRIPQEYKIKYDVSTPVIIDALKRFFDSKK